MHAARYWEKQGDNLQCGLCPHACVIRPGERGRCRVRANQAGALVAEAYGLISSLALDPIEKKPLYHVLPGAGILSLGSMGCNFRCSFCQNWTISQASPRLLPLAPEQLIREMQAQEACGIAYTYNEPIMNFEYVVDCSQQVQALSRINVMVSNGYIQREPLQELLPLIQAWNIDLKSIRPEFYKKFCQARLEPVLETIRTVARYSHLEITHLLVTGGNDDLQQVEELADFVASISPEIPLHLSRYFPQYEWKAPPTDPELLLQAQAVAQRKLAWVYMGNLAQEDASLRCPDCRTVLVSRQGYAVSQVQIHTNACPKCGRKIPGIFK